MFSITNPLKSIKIVILILKRFIKLLKNIVENIVENIEKELLKNFKNSLKHIIIVKKYAKNSLNLKEIEKYGNKNNHIFALRSLNFL